MISHLCLSIKMRKKMKMRKRRTYMTFLANEFFWVFYAWITKKLPLTNVHLPLRHSRMSFRYFSQFYPVKIPGGWLSLAVPCKFSSENVLTLQFSSFHHFVLASACFRALQGLFVPATLIQCILKENLFPNRSGTDCTV